MQAIVGWKLGSHEATTSAGIELDSIVVKVTRLQCCGITASTSPEAYN
jgi:hypothetical protein